MIADALCGRASKPPADPEHARALAVVVVRELAHRIFLDDADIRIPGFTQRLHHRTSADQQLLDAVLRGLLGASMPALGDPLIPLLVLGRGLVLELELEDPVVADLVARSDQHAPTPQSNPTASPFPQPSTADPEASLNSHPLPATIPTASPSPQPPPLAEPIALPGQRPPGNTTPVTGSAPESSVASAVPGSSKIAYIVGGSLAVVGILAVCAAVMLTQEADAGGPPPQDRTTYAPKSDPSKVTRDFAAAINNGRFDNASTLLCAEAGGMTRHVAEGVLPVKEFTVITVEMHNSTTAYLMAKAIIDEQSEPLVWQGTLRTKGGDWCLLDIRPEDDSPPVRPETRDAALEKMRGFITQVSRSDSAKAMTYACGTQQRMMVQTMVDVATKARAQLTVKPDPSPEGASAYTGSVAGRYQLGKVTGTVTTSRGANGTYCVSRFELTFK